MNPRTVLLVAKDLRSCPCPYDAVGPAVWVYFAGDRHLTLCYPLCPAMCGDIRARAGAREAEVPAGRCPPDGRALLVERLRPVEEYALATWTAEEIRNEAWLRMLAQKRGRGPGRAGASTTAA